MRKLIYLPALLWMMALPAAAQIAPRIDVSAGYSMRVFQSTGGARLGMNGWYGQGEYRIFRWLNAQVEGSGNYRNNGIEGNTSLYTFLVGPQFYPFGHRKFSPFGHVLWGQGVYRVNFPAYGGFPPTIDVAWHSGWEGGGGVDYNYKNSNRWKIRVLQVDYGQTSFYGHNQINYRASIGFIYTFGQKK